MERFLQKIKCYFGYHIIRLKQIPLRDKYAEPCFYCIACGKKIGNQ